MYRPDSLGGFLRLLVSHLTIVIDEGERLVEFHSSGERHALLLQAIETGDHAHIDEQMRACTDYEALFALQMSHAREWVDRLGQLDPAIERYVDEFLAATYGMERVLAGRARRHNGYTVENRLVGTGSPRILSDRLQDSINVEGVLLAIYELLARLEDHYDLVEDLLAERRLQVPAPFAARPELADDDKVICLSERRNNANSAGDTLLPQ